MQQGPGRRGTRAAPSAHAAPGPAGQRSSAPVVASRPCSLCSCVGNGSGAGDAGLRVLEGLGSVRSPERRWTRDTVSPSGPAARMWCQRGGDGGAESSVGPEGACRRSAAWRTRPGPRTVTTPGVDCLPVSAALLLRSRNWPARRQLPVRAFEGAEGLSGLSPRELTQGVPAASCGLLSWGPQFLAGGAWKRPWFPHPSVALGRLMAWQLVSHGVC